jgi:hypothetical protein
MTSELPGRPGPVPARADPCEHRLGDGAVARLLPVASHRSLVVARAWTTPPGRSSSTSGSAPSRNLAGPIRSMPAALDRSTICTPSAPCLLVQHRARRRHGIDGSHPLRRGVPTVEVSDAGTDRRRGSVRQALPGSRHDEPSGTDPGTVPTTDASVQRHPETRDPRRARRRGPTRHRVPERSSAGPPATTPATATATAATATPIDYEMTS